MSIVCWRTTARASSSRRAWSSTGGGDVAIVGRERRWGSVGVVERERETETATAWPALATRCAAAARVDALAGGRDQLRAPPCTLHPPPSTLRHRPRRRSTRLYSATGSCTTQHEHLERCPLFSLELCTRCIDLPNACQRAPAHVCLRRTAICTYTRPARDSAPFALSSSISSRTINP